MNSENRILIGIGIVTVVIIAAGVFFFSRSNPNREASDPNFDASTLVQDAIHTKGKIDAPVKIVEFGDIQCPACRSAQPIVEKMLEANSENVYFVFRHYPLSIHKNAKIAAQAAEAAAQQGKFFEMIHIQYERQPEWEGKGNPREDFRKYAQELNLDMEKFNKDMEDLKENVENDFALGNRAGVESTPTFFINGQKYPGVLQPDQFQQIIDGLVNPTESTPESSPTE